MRCERCTRNNPDVRKTRLYPEDFTPNPERNCDCAYLCGICRAAALGELRARFATPGSDGPGLDQVGGSG